TRKELIRWVTNPLVRSVSFSPDGKRLASVESAGMAVLRDVPTGKQLGKLEQGVAQFGFTTSGNLYFATRNGIIAVSQQMLTEVPDNTKDGSPARAVAFSPDGKVIASATANGVRAQNEAGKLVWTYE